MKCENVKPLLMDFLYGEAADEDIKSIKIHLADCESCQNEFRAFQETSKVLQKWEDADPKLNFIFVSEHKSFRARFKERIKISPRKAAYGLAIGFAAVFLLMALTNTEIRYHDGDFSVKTGLFRQEEQQQTIPALNQELLAQVQRQNIQLMSQMIQQSEQRQRQQLITALNQFSNGYESRRSTDLHLVSEGLQDIERQLNQRLERRTSDQFNDLIRLINAQQGRR